MVDGRLVMKRNYEEIYMYNGDILLGLAKIYNGFVNLGEARIYMNLTNFKIVKE